MRVNRVIAALGLLVLVAGACSSSSEAKRPVAKPGQLVVVMSQTDGGVRDKTVAPSKVGNYRVVAVAPDGTLYVGDHSNQQVDRLPKEGKVTTVVDQCSVFPTATDTTLGTIEHPEGCDLAAPHGFFNAWALDVDKSGTLYVLDFGRAISTIAKDGRSRDVVGGVKTQGSAGLPLTGPGKDVHIIQGGPMTLDPNGRVFFANAKYQVFSVGRDGIVNRVAGRPEVQTVSGDGGPAVEAGLGLVTGLAADGSGNLYVADPTRVRRIDPQGTIRTIAGSDDKRSAGDGGPATNATFQNILALAVDGGGNLFVADGPAVRRIARDGVITRIAGTGQSGTAGSSGPAAEAQLRGPGGLAVDGAGNLYIADGDRVLMVGRPGR